MGALSAEKQYSVHAEETAESRRVRTDEDEDGNELAPTTTWVDEEPAERPILRSKGNTGVKGVLADAARARESERIEREIENMKTQHRLQKMAITVDPSREQAKTEKEEEPDELLEDEDDEFFAEYRKKQMERFKGKKTFGFLMNVTQEEFVNCIDSEASDVSVVIHYYEDWHPSCVKINKLLASLAIQHQFTKFVRIYSHDVSDDFEEVALPAISIYRGGNLVTAQLRINESLPHAYDVDHLYEFLAGFLWNVFLWLNVIHGILLMPDSS
ncbi:hypothetical protein PROFUN_02445 [Planoprotostelium fungivorum]|uniref:Phosducin domain-containing protein n=1 Tax=Planoprotostelium fungivorum TaxID=1890364 RepID=A0A2P6NUV0_9EUKA|nr:hypothetical protein PROFUN_02445 [Planoprotostelium fungivorum]